MVPEMIFTRDVMPRIALCLRPMAPDDVQESTSVLIKAIQDAGLSRRQGIVAAVMILQMAMEEWDLMERSN